MPLSHEEKVELAKINQELRKRKKPLFYDPNFYQQLYFVRDPHPLKVALCSRRAGKSMAAGQMLLRKAWYTAGVTCLYLALTRESAKRIMWRDVLHSIDKELELKCKFRESDLSVTLPNGSTIYLSGADATESERAKILGQKFKCVVVDEASKYRIDLKDLVYSVLRPAVSDLEGSITLIGTPSNIKTGLFYELTFDQDPQEPGIWSRMGFSGRRWSAKDNPYMKKQWASDMEALRLANPNVESTPFFQQEYLGRWYVDDTSLCYKYLVGRNTYDDLPKYTESKGGWHYNLGVDLGYSDASAFVVAAYHDADKVLYFVDCYSRSGMDITAVAERIASYRAQYDLDSIIVDGANKQAVVEMQRRHSLPLIPANKTAKADFIELMNAEMISGRIKLHGGSCAELGEEYGALVWDDRRKDRRVEHPACKNHLCDAALYVWRRCYAYLSEKSIEGPPVPGSAAWYAAEVKQMEAAALERLEEQKSAEAEARLYGYE